MRREPLLPMRLTRFTYWKSLPAVPTSAEDLQDNPQLVQYAVTTLQAKFHRHLSGPCGEPHCPWDTALKGQPDRRYPFIVLQRYIKTNRVWWRDTQAQQVFKFLPAQDQAVLRRLDRQQKQCHRKWDTVLKVIERDQEVFRYIIEHRKSGQLGAVADKFRLSDANVRRIYAAYRSKAALLLGEQTEFDQLVKCPSIPRTDIKRLEWERAEGDRVPLPFPLSPSAPIYRDMQEVFAWFALALKNLKRYRNGHSPIPWPPQR